jgi:hypothetical protein
MRRLGLMRGLLLAAIRKASAVVFQWSYQEVPMDIQGLSSVVVDVLKTTAASKAAAALSIA